MEELDVNEKHLSFKIPCTTNL